MRQLSIRNSLWLWFVGLTALLLIAYSWLLLTTIRSSLEEGHDAELRARAEGLAILCEWEEDLNRVELDRDGELVALVALRDDEVAFDLHVLPGLALLKRAGKTLPALDPEAFSRRADEAASAATVVRFVTREGEGEDHRLCTLRSRIAALPAREDEPAKPAFEVVVRVASSLEEIEDRMAGILVRILILGTIALIALAAFGLFLSRRFVRPLRELEGAAAAMKAGQVVAMPRRGNGDEIDRLAGRLDQAIGGLGAALERQTRFTANAAHELRNPIAVIRNAAEVAVRRERSPTEYRAFLDDIAATSASMGRLVEALLTLARLDAGAREGRFTLIDPAGLVGAAVAALAPADAARLRFDAEEGLTLRGDVDLLRIAVDNLLANALRHAPGDESIDLRVTRAGDSIVVEVRDRGPGVPGEQEERVFEPFFRGDSTSAGIEGAGLGLSIVAAVARLHGGDCSVEDAGPGARVILRLPRALS